MIDQAHRQVRRKALKFELDNNELQPAFIRHDSAHERVCARAKRWVSGAGQGVHWSEREPRHHIKQAWE